MLTVPTTIVLIVPTTLVLLVFITFVLVVLTTLVPVATFSHVGPPVNVNVLVFSSYRIAVTTCVLVVWLHSY